MRGGPSVAVHVDVVERLLLQAQLADEVHHQRVAVGQPHRAGLGVLAWVGEGLRRLLVAAAAERLDAPAHLVAVGLQDAHVVSGALEQPGRDEAGRARPDDEDLLGPGRPGAGQAVLEHTPVTGDEGSAVVVDDEQGPGDGEAAVEVRAARGGQGRRRGGITRGRLYGQGRRAAGAEEGGHGGRARGRRERTSGQAAVVGVSLVMLGHAASSTGPSDRFAPGCGDLTRTRESPRSNRCVTGCAGARGGGGRLPPITAKG